MLFQALGERDDLGAAEIAPRLKRILVDFRQRKLQERAGIAGRRWLSVQRGNCASVRQIQAAITGGVKRRLDGRRARWIGADDRWRIPANEVAVRQHRIADAPVVETAMRVPSGDALHRVYGVAGDGDGKQMAIAE